MKSMCGTLFITLIFVLAAAGCSPGTSTPSIVPIDLNVSNTSQFESVKASGEVVPVIESKLSFATSGMVVDVLVSEGDLVKSGQALLALDLDEYSFAISAAEEALRSAEVNAKLQRIRDRTVDEGKYKYSSGPREQILVADAKVNLRQAELDTAKANLAERTLHAPFEGTIVEINVSPGEYVQASQVVMTLADLSDLQIETTDLSEFTVSEVEIGQVATVFIEALNEKFDGTVTAISPIADTIGGDVVFKVSVQLNQQPQKLLWGMSTDVEIVTE